MSFDDFFKAADAGDVEAVKAGGAYKAPKKTTTTTGTNNSGRTNLVDDFKRRTENTMSFDDFFKAADAGDTDAVIAGGAYQVDADGNQVDFTAAPPAEEWYKPGQFRTKEDEDVWLERRRREAERRAADEERMRLEAGRIAAAKEKEELEEAAVVTPVKSSLPVTEARDAALDKLPDQPTHSTPEIRKTQQETVNALIKDSEARARDAVGSLQGFQRTEDVTMGDVGLRLEDLLLGRMSAEGPDAIQQSQLADFNASADKARSQQIEDLQRFGVLGDGVSAGGVADVLGEFDSGIERGRYGIAAEAQRRQDADMDRAAQFNALETQLGLSNRGMNANENQFAANYDIQRLMTEQDLADRNLSRGMVATDATGIDRFEESARQARAAEALAKGNQQIQIGSLLGNIGGNDTLAARQMAQQDAQFNANLNLQGSQFDRSFGLDERRFAQDEANSVLNRALALRGDQRADRQLSQQNDQFLASLGLDRDRLDSANSQFDQDFGLRELLRQDQNEQERLSREQRAREFADMLNFDRQMATGQVYTGGENGRWEDTLARRSYDEGVRQFDDALGFDRERDERQSNLDRISRIIAATEAVPEFERVSFAQELADLLGVTLPEDTPPPVTDPTQDPAVQEAIATHGAITKTEPTRRGTATLITYADGHQEVRVNS